MSSEGFYRLSAYFCQNWSNDISSLLHHLRSSLTLSFPLDMPSSPIATRASFTFMYFWAFDSISAVVLGRLFMRATTNSLDFNPALKVVNCTLSSASSTSRTSLVKCFTYDLKVSLFPYLIVSRWSAGLF